MDNLPNGLTKYDIDYIYGCEEDEKDEEEIRTAEDDEEDRLIDQACGK